MVSKKNVMTNPFTEKAHEQGKKDVQISEKDEKELKRLAAEYAKLVKNTEGFDLDKFLVSMMIGSNGEPFYSFWSRACTKVKTNAIATAGVSVQKGDISMLWNPVYVANLPHRQIYGLLKHEFWHLILDHISYRRREPHDVWNISTDMAINSLLPPEEVGDCWILPGRQIVDQYGKEIHNDYADTIKAMPPGKASEWYFSELMSNRKFMDYLENGGEQYGQFDFHDGWDDLTDEEREVISGKIQYYLSEAIKEADAKNAWGSISASIREMLRSLVSNQIDWRLLLREFCGLVHSSERTTTIKKINKKYPYQHPGYKRKKRANINVYIDQSGSVSNDEISLLFGELANLAKYISFTVYFFDTSVDEEGKIVWRRGQIIKPERHRCGGTDFEAPIKHANKNKDGIDGLMILTDGECSQPSEPSLKKLAWVITPNNKLNFQQRTSEVLIQMKQEKSIT